MRERLAGNWFQAFRLFTQESEASNQYLWWSAASILSGALRRRVWIKRDYESIYPNLYVMLVGPAGSRKSRAISFTRALMRATGVPIAAEATSREGIIWHMMQHGMTQEMGDQILETSPIVIAASEFASIYRTSKDALLEWFNDIFDTEQYDDKPWTYEVRSRPDADVITRPYVVMLSGATPSWIADNLGPAATEHGFFARTIAVYAGGPRFYKSRPKVTAEMWDIHERMVVDLQHITNLYGQFTITERAQEWYDNWYVNEYPKTKVDYRLSTYLTRKPLHFWKLAQLIAISQEDDLVIDESPERPYCSTALAQLDAIEPLMPYAFSGVGKNPYASRSMMIWSNIQAEGRLSKDELLRRYQSELSGEELDKILQDLQLMKKIAPIAAKNGDVTYAPTGVKR